MLRGSSLTSVRGCSKLEGHSPWQELFFELAEMGLECSNACAHPVEETWLDGQIYIWRKPCLLLTCTSVQRLNQNTPP